MDPLSTVGQTSYTYTPSSTKTDTSASVVMQNDVSKTQADSAARMIESVTETTPSSYALPDHLGQTINVTA